MVAYSKTLRVLLLLPLLALSLPKAQTLPVASLDVGPGADIQTTYVDCWTAEDVVAAIVDPAVEVALLRTDITLSEAAFKPVSRPIVLSRNLTIMSPDPSPETWPTLDFAFLSSWIQLEPGVTLDITQIVMVNWRLGAYFQAPGFDIIAISRKPLLKTAGTTANGSNTAAAAGAAADTAFTASAAPVLLLWNATVIQRTCLPDAIYSNSARQLVRPPRFPGRQNSSRLLQSPACVDGSTNVPAVQRCWPNVGKYFDIAAYGLQEVSVGQFVDAGYFIVLRDLQYLCSRVMEMECAQRLGTVGCYYSMFPRGGNGSLSSSSDGGSKFNNNDINTRSSPALASAAPEAGTAGGSGGGEGGATDALRVGLLAGLLGGLGLLATIAAMLAAVLVRRRHRRRRSQDAMRSSAVVRTASAGAADGVPGGDAARARPAGTPDDSGDCDLRSSGGPGGAAASSTTAEVVAEDGSVEAAAPAQPEAAAAEAKKVASSKQLSNLPAVDNSAAMVGRLQQQQSAQQLEMVPVTPFTPPQPDIEYDVRIGEGDLELNPAALLGKGSFGRVVQGTYGGVRVAVKLLNLGLLEGALLAEAAAQAPAQAAGGVEAGGCSAGDITNGTGGGVGLLVHKQDLEAQQLARKVLVSAQQALAQEVEVLARCRHPNVVRLLAASLKPPRICLVMELMDTSLEQLLYGGGAGRPAGGTGLSVTTVVHIAMQIARALSYLHPTILHRDLKPGNVLISQPDSDKPLVKLADFGLSRLLQTVLITQNPEAGTTPYMAPEIFDITIDAVTDRVDIYSFGILLWEMLAGKMPWKGCGHIKIAVSVAMFQRRPPLADLIDKGCPPKLTSLIQSCWDHDPARRPAAAEAYKTLVLVQEMLTRGHTGSSAPVR